MDPVITRLFAEHRAACRRINRDFLVSTAIAVVCFAAGFLIAMKVLP